MKVVQKYKLNTNEERAREIRLFGFSVFLYGTKTVNNKTKKYFFVFPGKRFEEKILDLCINTAGDNFDDIYLVRVGLGEAYLMNFFIKELCKKNNSKNPVILNPQIKNKHWYCFTPILMKHLIINWDAMWALRHNKYVYKNHRIFVFIPINDVLKIGRSYLKRIQPHFKTLLEYVGLPNFEPKPIDIKFDDCVIKKCEEYLKFQNIDVDNFIFISKEALSISMLNDDFWDKLIDGIKNLGYDVCINSSEINITEAIYIAQFAKSAIALRSGFSEGLSLVSKKMFVFYAHLDFIPTEKFMPAYSLKKYPFVQTDNIYEYDIEHQNKDFIIKDIIQKLSKSSSISNQVETVQNDINV